jgi:hypothetical protein
MTMTDDKDNPYRAAVNQKDDLFFEGAVPKEFFGPDLAELCARQSLGLSDEWEAFRWEEIHEQAIQVTLAIPTVFKSGPRKGRRKWDRKNARVFVCSLAEYHAWRERWSYSTGNCLKCRGSGRECRGWSKDKGTRYRACRVCGGTGNLAIADGDEKK